MPIGQGLQKKLVKDWRILSVINAEIIEQMYDHQVAKILKSQLL
jgi:hypothetical protein